MSDIKHASITIVHLCSPLLQLALHMPCAAPQLRPLCHRQHDAPLGSQQSAVCVAFILTHVQVQIGPVLAHGDELVISQRYEIRLVFLVDILRLCGQFRLPTPLLYNGTPLFISRH